jgi:hypothetical protein
MILAVRFVAPRSVRLDFVQQKSPSALEHVLSPHICGVLGCLCTSNASLFAELNEVRDPGCRKFHPSCKVAEPANCQTSHA